MPKVEKTEQGKSRFTGKDEAVAKRPERDDIRKPTMCPRLREPNSSHAITTVVIKCEKKREESGLRSACLREISLPGIGSSAGQRSGCGARERSFASEVCKATGPTGKYRKVSAEGRPLALGYDM